jgi:16S rRNA (guanine966-N2)-methyltransferase
MRAKLASRQKMRISGGKARGILLDVPQGIDGLRPATDFLREAVFSSIGERIFGTAALDLFAGIGCYGLEALSRGAESCIFVEINHLAAAAIGDNAKKIKKAAAADFEVAVLCCDVFQWIKTCDRKFDVIFVDPPYAVVESMGSELLLSLEKILENSEQARIVLEVPGAHSAETPANIVELRRLGRIGHSRQPNALIYGKKQS